MDENLSHLYRFKKVNNEYLFTTDNGIEYIVFFDTKIQDLFEKENPKIEQIVESFYAIAQFLCE